MAAKQGDRRATGGGRLPSERGGEKGGWMGIERARERETVINSSTEAEQDRKRRPEDFSWGDRERDMNEERERDRKKGIERERSRDRERERSREREREREGERRREREREGDREGERERERERQRERERKKERERKSESALAREREMREVVTKDGTEFGGGKSSAGLECTLMDRTTFARERRSDFVDGLDAS